MGPPLSPKSLAHPDQNGKGCTAGCLPAHPWALTLRAGVWGGAGYCLVEKVWGLSWNTRSGHTEPKHQGSQRPLRSPPRTHRPQRAQEWEEPNSRTGGLVDNSVVAVPHVCPLTPQSMFMQQRLWAPWPSRSAHLSAQLLQAPLKSPALPVTKHKPLFLTGTT